MQVSITSNNDVDIDVSIAITALRLIVVTMSRHTLSTSILAAQDIPQHPALQTIITPDTATASTTLRNLDVHEKFAIQHSNV
jgi:hypothetical protein